MVFIKALFKIITLACACFFILGILEVHANNEVSTSVNAPNTNVYKNAAFGYSCKYSIDYTLYQFPELIVFQKEAPNWGEVKRITIQIDYNNSKSDAYGIARKYIIPDKSLQIRQILKSNLMDYPAYLIKYETDKVVGEIYAIQVADLYYIINFNWPLIDFKDTNDKGIKDIFLPKIYSSEENKENNLYFDGLDGYYYFAPNSWQRDIWDTRIQTLTQSRDNKNNLVGIAYFGTALGNDDLTSKASWFSQQYQKMGYKSILHKTYNNDNLNYEYFSWSKDDAKVITVLTLKSGRYYLIEAIIRNDYLLPQAEKIISSINFGNSDVK